VHEADRGASNIESKEKEWRLAWRRISMPSTTSAIHPKRHRAIVLSVSASLEPMGATLRGLALALCGLSGGIWLAAAVAGRWVCRQALAPVTRMATAARGMGAADLDQRLPGPSTPDELGKLHRAFNGLLDRLHEAFERQRRFTGDASHQLRTPLAAMLGQVEVVLRRERPADEYRRVLEQVQDQAAHLRRIVEALLFLARADAEADLARLELVDIAVWLTTYAQRWADHPRAGDLHVECKQDTAVRVQPFLLGQLVDNLIDNAFKYSEPGAAVTITGESRAGAFTLAVEDAGHGIPREDLPHVFEAFYRSADARRLGKVGVGLGLAMVQRIAAAFGGSVAAESTVGRGSRFTLCLPVPIGTPAGELVGPSAAG
jgi:heavy metal sensor kinase